MNTQTEFTKKLEDAIYASFPESRASVRMLRITGDPFCSISFTLGKDSSEYANGIAENDNVIHRISIFGFDSEGQPKGKMSVESSTKSFYVKTTNRIYAYDRVKTNWRNFSTEKQQDVVNKIGRYFDNLKKLLIENYDKMTDDTQKLMVKKGYIVK